jgi:hypothetical protein
MKMHQNAFIELFVCVSVTYGDALFFCPDEYWLVHFLFSAITPPGVFSRFVLVGEKQNDIVAGVAPESDNSPLDMVSPLRINRGSID